MYKNSELPTLNWVFFVRVPFVKVFGYVRYFPKIFGGVPRNLVFNIYVNFVDIFIRSLIHKTICKVILWKNTSCLLISIIRARYIARPRTIISKYLGKYYTVICRIVVATGLEYVIVRLIANLRFKVWI